MRIEDYHESEKLLQVPVLGGPHTFMDLFPGTLPGFQDKEPRKIRSRRLETVTITKYTQYIFQNKSLLSIIKDFIRALSHTD